MKFLARLLSSLGVVLAVNSSALAMPPSDCHGDHENGVAYCVRVSKSAGIIRIAITMSSRRESTKTITYTGRSTSVGSAFANDYYPGKTFIRYFGPDKIILQDDRGNAPEVYYR